MKLRCRMGLHRWARFFETDPDLETAGAVIGGRFMRWMSMGRF
jgi:hypothetical protein